MATGTKLMKEISDQFLNCKVCLEPFKEPKTLSCLHTFCCACVQQQYDAESNRPTRYTIYTRSVTCPLCRKKTDLPTGGVRRLPDNFLVSNLTEVLAKKCVSKVPPCEICHTLRPRNNDASAKCLDCSKLLCKACVELHVTTKVTQDHNLIDLEGQKDIECKVHPEETVRFYCEKCEACICVVCAFQEHKDHDVCSFNDGFTKHKATLENLLFKGRERMTSVGTCLKLIEKYETVSKELKERIRDLAISYTAQVRAKEKELLKKVDDLYSGDVTELIQNKAGLQESFDNLHSACNLTEIVMKDKGVEMLLLKKEIQSKLTQLLEGTLPAVPEDLQMDVKFVPGDVKLGEIFVPQRKELNLETDDKVSNGTRENTIEYMADQCHECRKRKEMDSSEIEKKSKKAKSIYTQTKAVDNAMHENNRYFSNVSSQIDTFSSRMHTSDSSVQTRDIITKVMGTGNSHHMDKIVQPENSDLDLKSRGTMTEQSDIRSLKTQTEESSIRDERLGIAAAKGSTYPNTGAAIAAAFLQHRTSDLCSSNPWTASLETQGHSSRTALNTEKGIPLFAKVTCDAEIATEISLGVTDNFARVVALLCQAEEEVKSGGVWPERCKPDLLAETCGVTVTTASPHGGRWICSRKVQTDVSAIDGALHLTSDKSEDNFASLGNKCITAAVLPSKTDPAVSFPPFSGTMESQHPNTDHTERSTTRTAGQMPYLSRVSMHDAAVMTSFKVRLIPEMVDKETHSEAVQCRDINVMTIVDTRTTDSQTQHLRFTDSATITDCKSYVTKSTSTNCVTSMDAETSMPQRTLESKVTWTDVTQTTERATSTAFSTSDTATCTLPVQRGDFSVQVRPFGVCVNTNTVPVKAINQHSQTTPIVNSRATMTDAADKPPNDLLTSHKPNVCNGLSSPAQRVEITHAVPNNFNPALPTTLPALTSEKATETIKTKYMSRGVGPDLVTTKIMSISTDTLHLLQVSNKETTTPIIKMVDDWTLTTQPQLINTGVSPPRPAVFEVGVVTMTVTSMDQATCTELRTLRESGTETCLTICDCETSTDKVLLSDAQTEAEVNSDDAETVMDAVDVTDNSCMTDLHVDISSTKSVCHIESQCQSPTLLNKEVNTTRHRRKTKEVQTPYSYIECMLCQHQDQMDKLGISKSFTDSCTNPRPPDTHDVGTMALSCLASPPGLVNLAVQTSAVSLYDKSVCTSLEFDEGSPRAFSGPECQDAATSTESLPYIGLLSEIDVDEIFVIPEAAFELVSDTDSEYDHVDMVDGETCTELLAFAEVGTQTLLPVSVPSDQNTTSVLIEDHSPKYLVSIGINTMPKVTFEKETCTPIRHLFSKGTMTFFVSKLDKATSTLNQSRMIADSNRTSGSSFGSTSSRIMREVANTFRPRDMFDKVTMTCNADLRDIAVETDPTQLGGRITQCISKLRNVSERLNSPTARKQADDDAFFGQSFSTKKQESGNLLLPSSPCMPLRDSVCVSPPRDRVVEEERQRQFRSLLAETEAVLKGKDLSPVRKAQPITTLKPRSPVRAGDIVGYASRSLPRQSSLDRQKKVKMGSQTTGASRLPLLRYNSAPGRIATVPTQTLFRKVGPTSPRTSPSKIPISQKRPVTPPILPGAIDGNVEYDSAGSCQKVQKTPQRPSLPSISETRTPSSCSDASTASFVSIDSGDSFLNPPSAMTSSHSRTPSNVTSTSDTASDVTPKLSSADTVSTEVVNDVCAGRPTSITSQLSISAEEKHLTSPDASMKQKKEKSGGLGFMQRLLSGKRKKDTSTSGAETQKSLTSEPSLKLEQQQQSAQQTTNVPHPPATAQNTTSSSAPPPHPVSSKISIGATVTGFASTGTSGSEASSPPIPPHHYPPLPDPNKTPPPQRKPRPFVYVRQRIFSIQQDNVEEVIEKREKGKESVKQENLKGKGEEKKKGKVKGKDKEKSTEAKACKEELKEKKKEKDKCAKDLQKSKKFKDKTKKT